MIFFNRAVAYSTEFKKTSSPAPMGEASA